MKLDCDMITPLVFSMGHLPIRKCHITFITKTRASIAQNLNVYLKNPGSSQVLRFTPSNVGQLHDCIHPTGILCHVKEKKNHWQKMLIKAYCLKNFSTALECLDSWPQFAWGKHSPLEDELVFQGQKQQCKPRESQVFKVKFSCVISIFIIGTIFFNFKILLMTQLYESLIFYQICFGFPKIIKYFKHI